MDAIPAAQTTKHHAPDVGELFTGFFVLGLTGFGGVLPLARHMMVEKRGWLTGAEFTDLLGLCQFLPGGNIINMSVAVGLKFRGIPGAFAAILGLIAVPTAVVIGLGVIYGRFADDPVVRHLFGGLAAAAAGLLISTAIKIAWPLRRDVLGLFIGALCVLAIAVFRLPLLPTLLTLAPLGIVLRSRQAS
ncbi:chromate transporter [Bradyrhizobium brasilense]|uniref:Chromate transporter n=1 Tax=Bradyrhizobium brasilense TaxID=1419277 RepID=A0A1G7KDM7_9BRAD|nr:chromate transporter [Bradyrhizobium brasilense]MCC8976830.1 chromate transporter [Bradyrhizobium brasilense]SDF35287.1 chromate transporter [Bradyrhizobium brasilense]